MKKILLNDNIYELDSENHSVYMVSNNDQRIILGMNHGFSIHMVNNLLSEENGVIEYLIDTNHLFYGPFLNFLGKDSNMVINNYEKQISIERRDDHIKLTFNSGKQDPIMNGLIMVDENDDNLDMITRFYRLFSDLYIIAELQPQTEILDDEKIYIRK